MRSYHVACLLALVFSLSACGKGDEGGGDDGPKQVTLAQMYSPAPGGTADPNGGPPIMLTVSGRITFDRLTPTPFGLSPSPTNLPARGILVQMIEHNIVDSQSGVIAQGATDANGDYSIAFSTDRDFYVRALVQAGSPAIDFTGRLFCTQNNAGGGSMVYSVQSPIQKRVLGSQTVNVNADLSLPLIRGGAFSIFDTVQRCCAALGGGVNVELLWAPGNLGTSFLRTQSGVPILIDETRYVAESHIGGPGIIIGGGTWNDVANTDHDEFDDAVLAHELMHGLMRAQSRDNNWGGAHNGEALSRNAAYGEGVPTGLGCALLGNRNYIDTIGLPPAATSALFTFDCENPGFVAGVPSASTGVTGYESEFAVAAAVWDLLDGGSGPASTDGETVNISFGNIYTALLALRTRNGTFNIAYLATLLQELIDHTYITSGDANTLITPYNAAFPPAGADVWPPNLTAPGMATGSLNAALGPNGTPANREIGSNANDEFRLALASPAPVTFNLNVTTGGYDAAQHRCDFYLYDLSNALVAYVTDDTQNKSLNVNLPAGEYLVRVHHAAASAGPVAYSLTIP